MTHRDSHDDSDLFDQLREISLLTRRTDQESEGRESLIRFLDTYSHATAEAPIVDSLCARFGLYPYMSEVLTSRSGNREALAVEFHTPPQLEEEGFTFHAEQQRIYQRLMDGESIILSAPTSFGKSVITDALLASQKWNNLVLVVPTIALIDETRRRLSRFRANYHIVTHPADALLERNVIIMTQERLLELPQLPDVDFFMIDEFYKLGSGGKNDSRRTLLNLAWNMLRATGAQYYLIGPNIDSLDERVPQDLKGSLYRTEFKTVAVNLDDRSDVEDQRSDLLDLLPRLEGSTLVFTGSPQKAEELGVVLGTVSSVDGLALQVADWIAANYDPDWRIVSALRRGVGVHTGPLPRGLQRVMVRLFNESLIPTLVCTSTLIEGVNTQARNVVIFEKKIDSQLIDFFTFSNIRGRAGRMFRHYVGNVISYMSPPIAEETSVDIPIETRSEKATDATLVQLDREELDEASEARIQAIFDQEALSIETIRRNRGLDPTRQVEVAETLAEIGATGAQLFNWTGPPTNDQARAVLRLAFEELLEPYQRRGMNFNMLWGQLQNSRQNAGDFRAQVDQQERYRRKGQSRSDVITDVLRFQRNWMGFVVPSMLRGLQSIQSEVFESRGLARGNYEFLLREIEALYLAPGLAELEEYGLPLPLGDKLMRLGLNGSDVPSLLEDLVRISSDPRAASQLDAVEQWILEDVLRGLGV
ncbi:MAG: DEAD/DEAH box helicase [Fimbriimonadaceae bacterium]|nr:DEAD/DEAH box helicase [Fimbriimonadaceae bacterium]